MCETTRKCRQQCFSVFKKVHNDLNFDETEKPEKTVKTEGRGQGGVDLFRPRGVIGRGPEGP